MVSVISGEGAANISKKYYQGLIGPYEGRTRDLGVTAIAISTTL